MNNFYLAKKALKWSGYLNIINFCIWSVFISLIFIYHFLVLIGNGNEYQILKAEGQSNGGSGGRGSVDSGIGFSWAYISQNGYSSFFQGSIFGKFIHIPFWYLILPLFLVVTTSSILKFLFGIFSIYYFIKARNIFLVYGAIAATLLPLFGGMIAINFYNATTNNIEPKFIAPYALLRRRLLIFWASLKKPEEKREEHLNA